jgi:hypothetical protein
MKTIGRFFRNVFFWTYERGSWQWDLNCLFFVVVIFTTPADFLQSYTATPLSPAQIHALLFG